MTKIKVFIVDDKDSARRVIRQILSEKDDIDVVAEAAGGQEAMDMLAKTPCDVVLLDIAMPGLDGFKTLKLILEKHPGLPVIMLSVFPENQFAARSIKAGAAGYIAKPNASNELTFAIRTVAKGEKYISISVAKLIEANGKNNKSPEISENGAQEGIGDRR